MPLNESPRDVSAPSSRWLHPSESPRVRRWLSFGGGSASSLNEDLSSRSVSSHVSINNSPTSLRSPLEHMSSPACLLDGNLNITYANKAFRDLLEGRRVQSFLDVIGSEAFERFYTAAMRVHTGQSSSLILDDCRLVINREGRVSDVVLDWSIGRSALEEGLVVSGRCEADILDVSF